MSARDYQVHRVDFLNTPDMAGLSSDFKGMGVLSAKQLDTGRTCTVLVDRSYALMVLTAQQGGAGGSVKLADTALRWVRSGWPDEWGADMDPAWVPISPDGAQ